MFITSVACGLCAPPLTARAQQAGRVYRIGLLRVGVTPPDESFWAAMRELGWIEGRNVRVVRRYADRNDQLPALAAEIVQSNVDLIMTQGTPAAQSAKRATQSIPIVFGVGSDPVGSGLVASMARPGGNLTGFVNGLYDAKLLQILKEALPTASRVAYPTSSLQDQNQQFLSAAKAIGIQVQAIAIGGPEGIGSFYATARKSGMDAVVIHNIAALGPHLQRLGSESAKAKVPAIGFTRVIAESGGLLSYGPTVQAAPRVAVQVDKILRGAKPGDLPVEQPTRFQLVINLKTAKTLGLTIPQALLLRADEVIQ